MIGRSPECQIVIRSDDEKQVSGRHLEIQFRSSGGTIVRDLGSRNGTCLNQRALKTERPLKVGGSLVPGSEITALVVSRLDNL